ncbi:MAG: AMP-binding protein [Verrucomicrobia bacterium]|nr:AMP-binding protein [Verrucomicrobiota bacterium]
MVEPSEHFNFVRDVMDRWASERPDAAALWFVDSPGGSEQRFSFRQLAESSRRAASFLVRQGIRRGDRVLIVLPRVPQWWLAMLGLIRLGAVPVPGTALLTAKDIRFRAKSAGACAIITDGDGAAKAEGFHGIRILVNAASTAAVPAGWVDFDAGLRAADAGFDPEPTRGDEPGIIYFTSGTTGHPKMVIHSQASYGLGHRVTGTLWLDLKPGDVLWTISDTGWAKAAWSSFFGPWQVGVCVFTLGSGGKFGPVTALQMLSQYPITTWCAPPTALRMIVREDLSQWQFPHLRHCVSAGEPLNAEVVNAWKAATGLTIYEGYGQTESVVLVGNFRALGHEVRPGWMGRATPGFELAVLDEQLREVPDGEEGELAVRVAPRRPVGLFREYWQNPAENADRFRGDWYLTHDRVIRDTDGYYRFVGRDDDVIKSSGYRIGPFEVESALIEHPAVLEAGVVGVPDSVRGQIVKAFVVLRKGVAASDALRLELQTHCKHATAPYKYPREVEFVPSLPKTISGKTRRAELRQRGRL